MSVAEVAADVAVAEPLWIDLDVEPRTEAFIEVIDVRSGHRVISSIELISPGNKRPGEGRDLYVQKRKDMVKAGVNTVEIDLLRGGSSLLPINPDRLPPTHKTKYLAWTWRAADPRRLAVYRMPLREPLPSDPDPARSHRRRCDRQPPGDPRPVLSQRRLRRHRLPCPPLPCPRRRRFRLGRRAPARARITLRAVPEVLGSPRLLPRVGWPPLVDQGFPWQRGTRPLGGSLALPLSGWTLRALLSRIV